MTADVHVRPMRDEDVPLIYSSWLHDHERSAMTLFADPDNERYVNVDSPRDAYFAAQKRVIAGILARPSVHVLVACNPEDHDQAFGWACWETAQRVPVVHYVFTKRPFRRMGVARRLWKEIDPNDVEVVATHSGSSSRALRQAGVRFRTKPFLALLSALRRRQHDAPRRLTPRAPPASWPRAPRQRGCRNVLWETRSPPRQRLVTSSLVPLSLHVARRATPCYEANMRSINVREFRNSSAAVLDAVEGGETVIITRNGAEIAEVKPIRRRRTFVPLTELLAAFKSRPAGQAYERFRADQDDFFGDDGDRL